MPKRRSSESDEQRWERKRKKYELKLQNKKRPGVIYSDEEIEDVKDEYKGARFWDETWPESEYQEPTIILSESDEPRSPTSQPLDPPPKLEAADGNDIDPELLQALGGCDDETTEWGPPIVEHLAMRMRPILLRGLKKEDKTAVTDKYPFPKNLEMVKAPTLNPEVSAMMTESGRNRDRRVVSKQNQTGSTLSAVLKAVSILLNKEHKVPEVISVLSDACRLLADSHYLETDTRRSLIAPMMEKSMAEAFKDRPRDEFLFGSNLSEMVKSSQGIKKTGELLQANRLNSKGPASRGQNRLRGYANRVPRGGGQRYPPRGPAPAPPPPPRRNYSAPRRARRPPPPPARQAPAPATKT